MQVARGLNSEFARQCHKQEFGRKPKSKEEEGIKGELNEMKERGEREGGTVDRNRI